jgi:hypothetical protein
MENIQLTPGKLVDNRLLNLGRDTPILLVKAIQADLFEKTMSLLKEAGAPEAIYEAFEMSDLLQLYIGEMSDGTLTDGEAEEVPQALIEAAKLNIKLGGKFLDGGSWTLPDSQIPAWGDCKVSSPTTEN